MGHSQKAWKTLFWFIFPAFYSSKCYFLFLEPSYFHFNHKYLQLALINDLTFQRKNMPPHLSRKFDELKMIFGFQKKNLAKRSALHFWGTHRSWCQGVWLSVSKWVSGPEAAAERIALCSNIFKMPTRKPDLVLTIVLMLAPSNPKNCDSI